jgi:hypothetical protein
MTTAEGTDLHALRSWWLRNRLTLLPLAIGVLSLIALAKLGMEMQRLVADPSFYGAIDLLLRHQEVVRWFAGSPIYSEFSRLMYPPQAYVMLWPFTGWLSATDARWLWALTSMAALAWLCFLVLQESGAADPLDRALAVVMVLSMNAVGVTLGNGQLIVHMLPALITAHLLLRRPDARWYTDAVIAVLLLFVLMKPTLSVPFAWAAIMTTRRVRPFALTAIGYVLLTIFAASFQQENALTLVAQWAGQESIGDGYGEVHSALFALGLQQWAMPASLLLLAALGLWTWRSRTADVWILMGVAAIVARIWTYHGVYDDVLILVPMVALFRIATSRVSGSYDVMAAVLLAATIAVMSAPGRLLGGGSSALYIVAHVAVWLAVLAFLVRVELGWRDCRTSAGATIIQAPLQQPDEGPTVSGQR